MLPIAFVILTQIQTAPINKANQIQAQIVEKQKADLEASQRALEQEQAQATIEPERPVKIEGCSSMIAEAGITDIQNASILINRESECNPYATNSSTGACGIAQELPCGKSGCGLGNGICQIKWMNSYILERYGSWAEAVYHSNKYNWY